ncbi:coiled-coil domain-containing protein [Ophiocordyceps camponoti-floridani]|uniref:Coiled-coil domain-containing protein n=1 Tax=Ophiocordyceps camponoti-floridani TaxID=2030778 RepID=A0A8H4Q7J3_9HYPO|nr:coiled-coil domain-containing protein [Ophiocordyceps camponoti-floridani]
MDARLTGPSFEKPTPLPPKTDAQKASIVIRNRRREYLERHPSYLDDPDHELADALLYERLITRFQTEQERDAQDLAKGYDNVVQAHAARTQAPSSHPARTWDASLDAEDPHVVHVADRDHGRRLWRDFIRDRFLAGADDDFHYPDVDNDQDLDVQAARDAQDEWFDDEEPAWHSQDDVVGNGFRPGETGVQDF